MSSSDDSPTDPTTSITVTSPGTTSNDSGSPLSTQTDLSMNTTDASLLIDFFHKSSLRTNDCCQPSNSDQSTESDTTSPDIPTQPEQRQKEHDTNDDDDDDDRKLPPSSPNTPTTEQTRFDCIQGFRSTSIESDAVVCNDALGLTKPPLATTASASASASMAAPPPPPRHASHIRGGIQKLLVQPLIKTPFLRGHHQSTVSPVTITPRMWQDTPVTPPTLNHLYRRELFGVYTPTMITSPGLAHSPNWSPFPFDDSLYPTSSPSPPPSCRGVWSQRQGTPMYASRCRRAILPAPPRPTQTIATIQAPGKGPSSTPTASTTTNKSSAVSTGPSASQSIVTSTLRNNKRRLKLSHPSKKRIRIPRMKVKKAKDWKANPSPVTTTTTTINNITTTAPIATSTTTSAAATAPCRTVLGNVGDERPAFCTCKRTQCLKLYCVCFQAGDYCNSNCKCTKCKNTPAHDGDSGVRTTAVMAILDRRSDAFTQRTKIRGKCSCHKSQ